MADKDNIETETEAFEEAYEAESENRVLALDDLRFSRLAEQWPEKIRRQRELEGRPVLTINKMPAFIRQVVNDSRQNRPQIKIKPVDDKADRRTAQMLEGLIRNIEYVSKADVAYDTAVDFACSMGWGYIRVAVEYEYDNSFDKGLVIQRVSNPFSVYGDPHSKMADSSDWNRAFVVDYMSDADFERKYKGAEKSDWKADGYEGLKPPWFEDDDVLVCESWHREIVKKRILMLSNGEVVGEKEYQTGMDYFQAMGLDVVKERVADGYRITQRIMTGAEVLETSEWVGEYIPLIPVYGEEVNIEGKRHLRSLIRDAKDAQRMFNYWRSTSTELVALAPRVPFIGEEGAFDVEPEKWANANTQSHPYLQYKRGGQPPMRQQIESGPALGAMSEAMAAADDMKSVIGMYDASLGQRSNETSGRAIMARQREGDVSTFHFIDNLARAIRHTGCVLLDMIPKTYSGQRIIRILGEDGKPEVARMQPGGAPQEPQQGPQQPVQPGQGQPQMQPQQPQQSPAPGLENIYDISVGRYDVAVSSGPGFTTRREEVSIQMTEFLRSFPQAAPVIGDILVKAMDWPQADEIADRLRAMVPQQAQGGMPPELAKALKDGQDKIKQLETDNQTLKLNADVEKQKVQIDGFAAQTDRRKVDAEISLKRAALIAQAPGVVRRVERDQNGLISNIVEEFLTPAMPQPQVDRQVQRDGNGMISSIMERPMGADQNIEQPSPPPPAPPPSPPVQINIGNDVGQEIATALIPTVSKAVADAMQAMPPLQVVMPPPVRMMRVPVRDQKTREITHVIEQPAPNEPSQ